MKQVVLALLLLALLSNCGGEVQDPPPADVPREIRDLNSKGFDFEWKIDHWEDRNVAKSTVFFYYPNGLGELDPGFGYTSSVKLDETAITMTRRDFFQSFGVDDLTQIWMLQLGEAILTDGETGGKSCRGNLCCSFVYDYPEYRYYCIP